MKIRDCSNVRNLQEEIALHTMRFYGHEWAEAKKRRNPSYVSISSLTFNA